MALYQYKCPKCGADYEVFQGIEEDHKYVCEICNVKADRVWTPFAFNFDFWYGFDEGAGKYFDSNRERNNYIAEKGLRRIRS